jgi:hypothetical protein
VREQITVERRKVGCSTWRPEGVVFAFLAVHVPPAPGAIICEAYAALEEASESQFEVMRAHLLAAAQELSGEALGRTGKHGNLAWATNTAAIRDELRGIGFRPTRKPAKSDCDRQHYLEANITY